MSCWQHILRCCCILSLFRSSSCALRPSVLCCRVGNWGSFLLIPAPSLFSKPDGLIMRAGPVHLSTDRLDFQMFSFLLSQPFPHINHLYVSVYESNDVLWKKGWIFLMELCHNLGTPPKKKTGFFRNFSQVSDPPPPPPSPPFGNPCFQKKKCGLFCVLGP